MQRAGAGVGGERRAIGVQVVPLLDPGLAHVRNAVADELHHRGDISLRGEPDGDGPPGCALGHQLHPTSHESARARNSPFIRISCFVASDPSGISPDG